MPAVPKEEALKLLSRAIEHFDPDELLEVYNEIFSHEPATIEVARAEGRPLAQRLIHYLADNPPEVAAELWWIIIPGDRRIWYNEEEDLIHYGEKADSELVW